MDSNSKGQRRMIIVVDGFTKDSPALRAAMEICRREGLEVTAMSAGPIAAPDLSALKEECATNAVAPDPTRFVLPGGATRSEQAPAYHLVPRAGGRRIALRFGGGAVKHGERNWEKCLASPQTAYPFAREAYNHMTEHASKMAAGLERDDDHLGAIGWAVMVLAEIEEKFGCRWTELPDLINKERIEFQNKVGEGRARRSSIHPDDIRHG